MNAREENAYQLLGLEQGPASTEAEIKKAYRKLALLKHPDKNPDNPNAASEFAALQRAYDILLDTEARAALDALLQAQLLRQERDNFRTDKRRKMVDDLQQREIFAETHRSQEQQARDRLEREIDRLRKKAAERQAAKQAAANEQQNPEKKSAQDGHTDLNYIPSAPQQDQIELPLAKTLKVSWSKGIKDYTAADLKSIFGAIGPVEDVVLRDKSKKGSALVIMVDKSDAEAAAVQVLGKGGTTATEERGDAGKREAEHVPLISKDLPKQSFIPRSGVSKGLGEKPKRPLFAAAAARPKTG